MMLGLAFAGVLAWGAAVHFGAPEFQRPPIPVWQTDAQRCTWEWRRGGDMGLWAETCQFATGSWQVIWDADLRAFVLRHDGVNRGVLVQSWPIGAKDGIQGLTSVFRDAGHLKGNVDCVWRRAPELVARRSGEFFVLSPAAADAMRPSPAGEVPDPQCGPYGASSHGVRYFYIDPRWPDRVIFVDEGQERPLFDPASITVVR